MDEDPIIRIDDKINNEVFEAEIIPNTTGALNQQINDLKRQINEANKDIYRLESHNDVLDYSLSACCGVLCGVLDIILNLNLNADTSSIVNEFASKLTDANYNNTEEAVKSLNSKLNSDAAISNLNLAKQASLFGLAFSVISAITGVGITLTKHGGIKEEKMNNFTTTGVLGGVFYGMVSWLCYLISSNAKINDNVPSQLLGLIEEARSSGLKIKNDDLANQLSKAMGDANIGEINKGIEALKLVGKEALVVGVNEVIVRAIYFVRHLFMEIKSKKISSIRELDSIDYKKINPFNNRSVARMVSVSLAAMMTIDLADAVIESIFKSQGDKTLFASNFFVRINYVGVARIILAISTDVYMGNNLRKRRVERINTINEYNKLLGKKIYYKQADMWHACEDTGELINETYKLMEKTDNLFKNTLASEIESLKSINQNMDKAMEKNKGLKDELKNIIDWE